MASTTAFRQAVQDVLEQAYGFKFVAGDFQGPSTERDLGCVWYRSKREWQDVLVEEILLGVRVFAQFKQQEGATGGPNEEEIEAASDRLQTALLPYRTTLGPWMCRVTEVEPLREQSAIEGTILGYQTNLGGG